MTKTIEHRGQLSRRPLLGEGLYEDVVYVLIYSRVNTVACFCRQPCGHLQPRKLLLGKWVIDETLGFLGGIESFAISLVERDVLLQSVR